MFTTASQLLMSQPDEAKPFRHKRTEGDGGRSPRLLYLVGHSVLVSCIGLLGHRNPPCLAVLGLVLNLAVRGFLDGVHLDLAVRRHRRPLRTPEILDFASGVLLLLGSAFAATAAAQ